MSLLSFVKSCFSKGARRNLLNPSLPRRRCSRIATGGTNRTLSYDPNGSLTSDGGTRTFEWDGANRLVAVNYTGTTQRTEFSYDGLNRCVKVVEKTGTMVNSTRKFVLCGTEKCEYRNASGAVQLQLFSQGQYQGGSGTYFYTRDHLGSIREMTDASGTVVARYDYDPWGRSSTVIGTNKPDFNFTGLYQHAKSGLDMAVYRAYDPDLGRWLSRDPAGEAGGINLYRYVANDSVNLWDPDGLDPQPAGAGWNRFVINPSNFGERTVADFFYNQLKGNYVTHPNKLTSGQCAAGAQYATGVRGQDGQFYDAPSTSAWQKGDSVSLSTPVGTMIARGWRPDGTYHNGDLGIHTGIFGGSDSAGYFMYDQNNPGVFKKQYINPRDYNEALSRNSSDSRLTKCGIGPTR